MNRKYFGTDGVRGKVGVAPITPDFVMHLGFSAGKVLTRLKPHESARPTVLIGKDTRISGYMLEAALQAGFAAAGVDVLLAGPMPTPAIAYLTRALRLSAGVVISASHNPFDDNGIKFFSAQGTKLPDQVELEIEAGLEQAISCVASEKLGKVKRLDDAQGRYIEFCKSSFPNEMDLRGLKIVVDCAHGAAYHIAPHVFHELGAEVISLGCSPDGFNINKGVGATHPESLVKAVMEHKADYGVALDGDADRLQFVDSEGRLFNGDEILYLMVDERLSNGQKVEGVVGTLMTNMAVELALKARGVEMVRAKVGDRYVLEELDKKGWTLGGEGSGHLLALDKHTTGDGIISALQVLQACVRNNKKPADILKSVPLFPQVLLNVPLRAGMDWELNHEFKHRSTQISNQLKGQGRLLIRASGTEPLLRIMVEAKAGVDVMPMAQYLAEAFDV